MKQITGVYTAPRPHWVGDGFPVRSLFSYQSHTQQLSPFLLLDYAGPHTFTPGNEKRGVGEHPHRGFETVTIVYSGEVEHRDSTGRGGVIGPGDVQWMTAGAGILHEEFHSDAFTRQGGELEMVQLWVNLPMKDKMTTPAYQSITQDVIRPLRCRMTPEPCASSQGVMKRQKARRTLSRRSMSGICACYAIASSRCLSRKDGAPRWWY
ncbi:pirin-like protein [Salmonella enterica subsp. arizonae]|uniref:Pirin-like protein n=1 Tax=Salmonella enterica subsp. arizonae TaxID=59203 RepID=A0A379SX59_SALER|nr:pirin-like protein [Salmonella enterica subsp. arizonae]